MVESYILGSDPDMIKRYGIEVRSVGEDRVKVHVPDDLEPAILYFLDRMKRELDLPFDVDDVVLAYIMAMNRTVELMREVIKQAVQEKDAPVEEESTRIHREGMESFFGTLKQEAPRAFVVRRASEPELERLDSEPESERPD
jgi:hypothetical protein